jgi:hypothetical protein
MIRIDAIWLATEPMDTFVPPIPDSSFCNVGASASLRLILPACTVEDIDATAGGLLVSGLTVGAAIAAIEALVNRAKMRE